MVDQLRVFAAEVTRVAREVGTEGMLGGQAAIIGVDGTWKDLTDNVNLRASNLRISYVLSLQFLRLSHRVIYPKRSKLKYMVKSPNSGILSIQWWIS